MVENDTMCKSRYNVESAAQMGEMVQHFKYYPAGDHKTLLNYHSVEFDTDLINFFEA